MMGADGRSWNSPAGVPPGFQALTELWQFVVKRVHIGLHGRRGLFPGLWSKGKGQTVLAGLDRGSMTSPGSRQQGQTYGHAYRGCETSARGKCERRERYQAP